MIELGKIRQIERDLTIRPYPNIPQTYLRNEPQIKKSLVLDFYEEQIRKEQEKLRRLQLESQLSSPLSSSYINKVYPYHYNYRNTDYFTQVADIDRQIREEEIKQSLLLSQSRSFGLTSSIGKSPTKTYLETIKYESPIKQQDVAVAETRQTPNKQPGEEKETSNFDAQDKQQQYKEKIQEKQQQ